jgi:hypothetical protein
MLLQDGAQLERGPQSPALALGSVLERAACAVKRTARIFRVANSSTRVFIDAAPRSTPFLWSG